MRWLFRCNVASERFADDDADVQGIGHAMRCLSVARAAEAAGDVAMFTIEGADDIVPFLEKTGLDFRLNRDHFDVAQRYDPDVVVTDVNYCDRRAVERFRDIAPVVNLAPRGEVKYYADLTFTSEAIRDVPEPDDAMFDRWYSGPEYTIISDDFVRRRAVMDGADPPVERGKVVINMGGVDESDRTGKVLELLSADLVERLDLTITAGPFNPNADALRARCDELGGAVEFLHAPDDLAAVLSGSEFAVLGAGISTYEALAIGVPSLNVGLSSFHDERGAVLESEDLGVYLGNVEDLTADRVNDTIGSLLGGDDRLDRIRSKGFHAVDGSASEQILSRVRTYLNDGSSRE
ncbi:hypothetical protein [Halosimplex salinum]|uniref:hypothetical protein n=1 Tax=Halosimplex salinum TaxID=1710538 RepID=UPI0013DD9E97|nr:hypothetical protein [Halosimplex salinum]